VKTKVFYRTWIKEVKVFYRIWIKEADKKRFTFITLFKSLLL